MQNNLKTVKSCSLDIIIEICWCQYRMTGQVLVPGVPHKPQGDPKSEVLSLYGRIAAP